MRSYAEGKAVGIGGLRRRQVYADGPCAYAEGHLRRRATPTAAVGIAYADGFCGYADGQKPSA